MTAAIGSLLGRTRAATVSKLARAQADLRARVASLRAALEVDEGAALVPPYPEEKDLRAVACLLKAR